MHRLLARQLKKLGLNKNKSPDVKLWELLINQIDKSYCSSDQDRYTLERSLMISSDEMQVMHQRQKVSYESRMEAIYKAMPDVTFILTERALCVEVMSGNLRLLEKNKNMALGQYPHEVFPKEQADIFESAIKEAVSKKQLVIVNYDLELDDGIHNFEGRVMPSNYRYKDEKTVVFIAVDITKQEKSQVQSKLISTVFANSKEGMCVLDSKFKLNIVNEAFCRLNDETTESIKEAIPKLVNRLLMHEQSSEIKSAVINEGYWIGEISQKDNNGRVYPLWLTINTVKNNKGKIGHYVIMLTDVSEIKRSQEELQHVATHDALTNLPNRILFQDRLQQAVNRTRRNSSIGALFFLDLDRFKNINDNLGHQIGDDLLVQVGNRLIKICREADTLARIGGDEFTLVVEGISNTAEISLIAEKIIKTFTKPFKLGGYKLDITVSIGISVFPNDSDNPLEIVKHADTAMYSAKDLGKNGFQFYTQELTSNAFEYFAIEVALKKALELNQFFLLYQPQYDIETKALIGVEALIRWRHPDMGVVPPVKFISIAETTGQIEIIGEWVIREACRQRILWDELGLPDFTLSINLSRKQLVIPSLSERVKRIIAEENVDGHRLEFEITESAILDNKEIVYANLKAFKAMGIEMAIDDFGTGYSSLVNLKQFPLSRLKIDQSFVRDVDKDKNDEAIIKATIALGKSLQLKIIAEGVENERQQAFLYQEGCDQVQGFLYSKPLLPDEICELYNLNKNSVGK